MPQRTRADQDCIVVAVTAAEQSARVIDRAVQLAGERDARLVGIAIAGPGGFDDASSAVLRQRADVIRRAGGTFHELVGHDVTSVLADFMVGESADTLVLGRSVTRWPRRSIASRLESVDAVGELVIVSGRTPSRRFRHSAPVRRGQTMPRSRLIVGSLVAAVTLPLATALLTAHRTLSQAVVFLTYLALVVVLAAIGGPVVGVVSAAAAFLLVNWFFTEPLHTLDVADGERIAELVIFLAVSGTVAALVSFSARQAQHALRLRTQADLLARAAATAVGEPDPVDSLLADLGRVLGAQQVRIAAPGDARSGVGDQVDLADGSALVIEGALLDNDGRVLARGLGDQLVSVRRTRDLAAQAERAEQLRRVDDLRSALLRAVSHDLRTPITSAKMATSSLLAADVSWSEDDRRELLVAADGELDRLVALVQNLLDASRIEAGAVTPTPRDFEVNAAVDATIASLPSRVRHRARRRSDTDLVVAHADRALVDRVVANLLSNALAADPGEVTVHVVPADVGIRIEVVDHGPGIPAGQRDQLFGAFRRLDDRGSPGGVGLGLSICAGFCRAMAIPLTLDETPGGGTTAQLLLPGVDR